uniref:Uncharacterized protein n=1 Tax=Panagrellus redivivus TaxID=6233 RepID=A0A7E4VXS6_PANRE
MSRLLGYLAVFALFVVVVGKKTTKINKEHAFYEIETEPFVFTIDRSNCPAKGGVPGCVCYGSESSPNSYGGDFGCGNNNGFICTLAPKAEFYAYSTGEIVSVDTLEFHKAMPFKVTMKEVEDGEAVPFLSIGQSDECSTITATYLYPAGQNSALDNTGQCESCECH